MTLLKRIWEGWKKVARVIGDFNARLIMTIFYFIFLGPLTIPVRLKDPLGTKSGGWKAREEPSGSPLQRALRQF
jgi:hypothetical protein